MGKGMKDLLMNLLHLTRIPNRGDDWYKVSAKSSRDYEVDEKNPVFNWKEQVYGVILDILMVRFRKFHNINRFTE